MKRMIVLASLTLATLASAGAQTSIPDQPNLDAKACADRDRLALAGPQMRSRETDGANPSEKLARTDGVICPPPELDPNIRAHAPGGGRTIVVPPKALEPGTEAK